MKSSNLSRFAVFVLTTILGHHCCDVAIVVDGFSGMSLPMMTRSSKRTTSSSSTSSETTTTLYGTSKHMVDIDDSNFRDLFRSEQPVLVDCYAQWCGPCKLIEPVLDECAKQWRDTVVIGKYDVESGNDEVKIELLLQGIMPQSLPALILIHQNKVLTTHKGIIRPHELNAMLEKHIVEKQMAVAMSPSKETVPRQKAGLISFATAAGGGSDDDDYMLRQK